MSVETVLEDVRARALERVDRAIAAALDAAHAFARADVDIDAPWQAPRDIPSEDVLGVDAVVIVYTVVYSEREARRGR